MTTTTSLRERLRYHMGHISAIDTHEHLRTSAQHAKENYTFFHLFIPYTINDLYSAGMPKRWMERGPANDAQIEQCWDDVEKVWPYVKHGSYARPTLLALKEFWGIGDITRSNYKEIGALLNATREPNHYCKVLVEKCGIEMVLNQVREYSHEEPFMKGAFVIEHYFRKGRIKAYLESAGESPTLEGYCEWIRREMKVAKEAGAVQIKFDVSQGFCRPPDTEAAFSQFEMIRRGEDPNNTLALGRFISDRALTFLPEIDLVAAVHTGVWNDIRDQSPEHLFSIVAAHPDVTFDIYHMGIPYARECGFLGKNYPNAYMNLCWSHIISPEMVIQTLGEWLDYVPVNKIFGFGGDFLYNPEQTWGALQVAKDNLAEVFARRIERGLMDIDSAEHILQLWLHDNPARVYRL